METNEGGAVSPGERELGVLESAQVLTSEAYPFNLVIVLRISQAPRPETLRLALHALQARHPLLRCRILARGARRCFVTGNMGEIPFSVREKTEEGEWTAAVEEELAMGFDVSQGPLLRVRYLKSRGSTPEAWMIITADHCILDAASGTSLVRELLTYCADLEAGRPPVQDGPRPLAPPADELFPAPYRGWSGRKRVAGFLGRQILEELWYRYRSRGGRKPPLRVSGRTKVLPMCLSPEETSRLVRGARRRRVTLASALSAALLLAVKRRLYGSETETLMRTFVIGNLRPYLVPPPADEDLGSYFTMLRITTAVRTETDLWDLAVRLNGQIYTVAKRGDKFTSSLMTEAIMRMFLKRRNERMGSTALSYTGPALLPGSLDPFQVTELHAFTSNFVIGPEYTAQVRLFAGRFWWDIVYLDCDVDQPTAQSIADDIRGVIVAAAD